MQRRHKCRCSRRLKGFYGGKHRNKEEGTLREGSYGGESVKVEGGVGQTRGKSFLLLVSGFPDSKG